MGSLWKIFRRTSGPNWALWRKVLIPMATHHPVEPSARAISSITRRVVRMSAPWPPSSRETPTLKSPASAISSTRSLGSWRAASISSARARSFGASARAISSGLVTADEVGVVVAAMAGPSCSRPRHGVKRRASEGGCPRKQAPRTGAAPSELFQPRIERVAKAVAEEVEAQHGHEDRETREQRQPGVGLDEGDVGLEVPAPARRRRLRAQAQEAERRLHDDRGRDAEGRGHDDGGQAVGQHVTEQDG